MKDGHRDEYERKESSCNPFAVSRVGAPVVGGGGNRDLYGCYGIYRRASGCSVVPDLLGISISNWTLLRLRPILGFVRLKNMPTKSRIFPAVIASFFLGSALLAGTAKAEVVSHSKNLIIEQPANLPELAQRPGIAFYLYTESGDGDAFLYVEQHNGQRLVVFDVTDPAHIKMVRSVNLAVPEPFKFAEPVGASAILVRFDNNRGVAVLDLHKAKAPVLRTVSGLQYSGHAEPLGESTFMVTNNPPMDLTSASRDYQIVDASNATDPVVLYSANLVPRSITRDETGTTFLLGQNGLTVIRRPRVEQEYQAEQVRERGN